MDDKGERHKWCVIVVESLSFLILHRHKFEWGLSRVDQKTHLYLQPSFAMVEALGESSSGAWERHSPTLAAIAPFGHSDRSRNDEHA